MDIKDFMPNGFTFAKALAAVIRKIEASIAYWDNPSKDTKTSAAASAAASAYASAYASAKSLKSKIQNRAICALKQAIEAGPNGGIPETEFVPRIEAVREVLPLTPVQ